MSLFSRLEPYLGQVTLPTDLPLDLPRLPHPEPAIYEVGQTLYRAEVWSERIHFVGYTVVAVTPKGCRVKGGGLAMYKCYSSKGRWVSATTVKRFAFPTHEEALNSLIATKRRYVKNCRGRANEAARQLRVAWAAREGLGAEDSVELAG